jgi:hypothetical protein
VSARTLALWGESEAHALWPGVAEAPNEIRRARLVGDDSELLEGLRDRPDRSRTGAEVGDVSGPELDLLRAVRKVDRSGADTSASV